MIMNFCLSFGYVGLWTITPGVPVVTNGIDFEEIFLVWFVEECLSGIPLRCTFDVMSGIFRLWNKTGKKCGPP